MSLTDLKRKLPKNRRKAVSVDDFIEDANNYAFGKKSLIDGEQPPQQTTAEFIKGLDKNSAKVYRRATFTLTEKSISQLDEINQNSNIAKSKILRILIDDFCSKSSSAQTKLLNKKRK
ncbi:replication protein RepA [Shewanella maritima]|uniref:Replication protein RepA n=1 Tax=Shewanella maritima TaxID=2520507 RepID=A0A411PLH2_9GAMM|nr:replication protein RepA [Shewanella maritima]QBF84393.1 replication protein RepA [Shewanella maritima]